MTELEKMKHACNYMVDLANGIDPITKEKIADDSCLNNVRLSRCFFYVADVLGQVIKNGGQTGARYVGTDFVLTDEYKSRLQTFSEALSITDFARPINEISVEYGMKKIPVTAFTEWLVETGYLYENVSGGKKRKLPTEKGEEIGIFSRENMGPYGMYVAVYYKTEAQKFLIDNIERIVKKWKGES